MDIQVENVGRIKVTGLPHLGPYHEIGATWQKLMGFLGETGQLAQPSFRMMSVYVDDITTTPQEELRSFATVTAKGIKKGTGFEDKYLGGECACAHYVGPYEGIGQAWAELRAYVCAQPNLELRASACFEEYLNDPSVTPAYLLETRLYMPVKSSAKAAKRPRAKSKA